MENRKFAYIRDCVRNFDRVLTIAFEPTGRENEYVYGYSVNKPTEVVKTAEGRNEYGNKFVTLETIPGDPFNRKFGRHVAEERLAKSSDNSGIVTLKSAEENPLEACLNHISLYSKHRIVREIAEMELEFRQREAEYEKMLAQIPDGDDEVQNPDVTNLPRAGLAMPMTVAMNHAKNGTGPSVIVGDEVISQIPQAEAE